MTETQDIGTRIKLARWNQGLSQRAAAERLEISRETLRQIELGQTPQSPRVAKAVADLLSVEVSDLWPLIHRTGTDDLDSAA